MNTLEKNSIHIAINEPEKLAEISAAELEKISLRYPYFNVAQLMLTKLYQRDEDYRFTDQLHQTALHTPDRAVLYDLVHTAKLKKAEISTETTSENPVVAEVFREFKSESIPPAHEPEKSDEPVIQVPTEEDDEIASIIAGKTETVKVEEKPVTASKAQEPTAAAREVAREEIAELPVADTKEDSAEETTGKRVVSASDLEPLEREILLEAISSSIELEVSETEEEETTAVDTAPANTIESEDGNPAADEPMSMAAYLARRAKEIRFAEYETERETETEQKTETERENESGNGNGNENENEITEWPGEQESTTLSHGHQKIQAGSEREHQQALIDRFIKAEPRITPGKAAEYNLQTVAKDSLEEDFEFVTETMARLFAQQGKPDKARKAFKKLMEQHPEKSVYFAAQLKNLDRLKKP